MVKFEGPPQPEAGRGTGCMSCLIVLVAALAVLAYGATDSTYPNVKPTTLAHRVFGYASDAYAALGIDRTIEPGPAEPFSGNNFGSSECRPDGWFSFADPAVEGAYRLNHEWTMSKVHKAVAAPALRRLRDHLEAKGWEITDYDVNKRIQDWEVRAERDGYETHAMWEPKFQRLSGFTSAPCAMDPDWPREKREQEMEDEYYGEGSYDGPSLDFPPALTPA